MNKQITRLTLDVGLRDSYKVVFAKMGDTERRVIAEIKDNGEDYSLAGVNTVEVRCRKADGKQVTKNATKDNNTIVIDISGQMTTCKGTAIVDVVLYGTDGGVLSTAKFYLNVDDGAVNEDDIKSSNEYESLTDALRTVGLAKEVANTALNTANEAVKTAESAMKQIPGYTSRAETAASKAEENKTAAANSASAAAESKTAAANSVKAAEAAKTKAEDVVKGIADTKAEAIAQIEAAGVEATQNIKGYTKEETNALLRAAGIHTQVGAPIYGVKRVWNTESVSDTWERTDASVGMEANPP